MSYKKYFSLQVFKDRMETLVIGSSHGHHGYRAQENLYEINACETSQDLYYSYELYKKYSDAARLKNIVLFYSVFSPGHILELTERNRCDSYKFIYGIPYRFLGICEKKGLKEAFSVLIERMKNHPDFHYVGNLPDNISDMPPLFTDAERRAKDHLKSNKRNENQTVYVEKAIKLSCERGHRLYIVIPPARSDYRNCLPPFEELFAELLKLKNQVKILSFFEDEHFSDSDFWDTDHLNKQGSMKLTAFIRDMMDQD